MYGVHITFDDGHEPVTRFHMDRKEYGNEMRKWQVKYDLEIDQVDEYVSGDRLIFFNAYERSAKRLIKNIERAKSRARYYTRAKSIDG